MRAPISVVIPTLNAEAGLPGCLQSLMEGVQSGMIRELIVSDGGSTDATLNLAEEAGAHIISGPASRGGQLLRGCAAVRADWLLVLHADTELEPGWSQIAGTHMTNETAGYFRLAFDRGGIAPRIVAGWANLRARLFGLPYGDQGLLLPMALYHAAGGYPDQPLMEDVALARALRGQLVALDGRAVTSSARYVKEGWLRRGARNLGTLLLYLAGRDPAALAKRYRRGT